MLSSAVIGANQEYLAGLTLGLRLPAVTIFPDFARRGGLMAYGINPVNLFRQSALLCPRCCGTHAARCHHHHLARTRRACACRAADTRTFKDSMGREIGRSTTHGNTTTFRDSMGRETGRAVRSGNGTTFYDNFGRETGRSLKVGQCPSGFMQSGAYCIDTRRR
jgi:hypothetical protein